MSRRYHCRVETLLAAARTVLSPEELDGVVDRYCRGMWPDVSLKAAEIADRLVRGRDSLGKLSREYRCRPAKLKEVALTVLSPEELERALAQCRGGMRRTQFRKGGTPWNAGMKGVFSGGDSVAYRKGQIRGTAAKRYLPVGSIVIRADGRRTGTGRGRRPSRPCRRWIKVEGVDGSLYWKSYSRHVWEQSNGPVPKGLIIVHLDGDTLNDDPANLAAMSRAEAFRHCEQMHPRRFAAGLARAGAAARARAEDNRQAQAEYGPVVTHFECASCGADFDSDPGTCPKCGSCAIDSWTRREGIEQRLRDHVNEQEEIDTDD